ncbi:MAG: hypothetical protein U5K43_14910 [Halofilum sp. (in: g-proteobacteria)]|nr:hypothetical protein [Halofilum sp. (in: g-proteobacteria)]
MPFCLVGNRVEIRGGARDVQILHEATIVATHPRAGIERMRCSIRPTTRARPPATVTAPVPLRAHGHAASPRSPRWTSQQRPMDLYAALAEVAR